MAELQPVLYAVRDVSFICNPFGIIVAKQVTLSQPLPEPLNFGRD